MTNEDMVELIKRELPDLLQRDPSLRGFILDITQQIYAPRQKTEDRFDRILDELRQDREEQAKKWAQQDKKWHENNQKLEKKWAEQDRKWDEQNRKWDEQNRKWDENQSELLRLHEEVMANAKKLDRSIGGLGARWGMQSEATFRQALAGILEENFDVEVLNINEYDETGEVFGRPEQVELDIIIKNGILLICELKSSVDKAGMYIFERKARFYEKRHNRKANRLIMISPMVEFGAEKVANRLGIEVFSDSIDVKTLI